MPRTTAEQLLLGEWACLGVLYQGPMHGFAIASRLKPDGDIGRVWSLSRPLTYRSPCSGRSTARLAMPTSSSACPTLSLIVSFRDVYP